MRSTGSKTGKYCALHCASRPVSMLKSHTMPYTPSATPECAGVPTPQVQGIALTAVQHTDYAIMGSTSTNSGLHAFVLPPFPTTHEQVLPAPASLVQCCPLAAGCAHNMRCPCCCWQPGAYHLHCTAGSSVGGSTAMQPSLGAGAAGAGHNPIHRLHKISNTQQLPDTRGHTLCAHAASLQPPALFARSCTVSHASSNKISPPHPPNPVLLRWMNEHSVADSLVAGCKSSNHQSCHVVASISCRTNAST
jgi:hypothetical protein